MSSSSDHKNLYSLSCEAIDGKHIKLRRYRGNVLLIVNTASLCHLRRQLADLQELHERMKPYGLEILAFPCSQFMNQEEQNVYQISDCYKEKYGVEFQLFRKVKVNGQNAHPVFKFLKEKAPGALSTPSIKWNFTKFLVSHDGEKILRFSPNTNIESILHDVVLMLEEKMHADKKSIQENGVTTVNDLKFELVGGKHIAKQKILG